MLESHEQAMAKGELVDVPHVDAQALLVQAPAIHMLALSQ